jgi:hypothetical protein
MTNTYRATSEYGRAVFGEDVFDADFTVLEERDHLDGHIELVPRAYTVTSDDYAAGKKGDVVQLALPIETEAALVSGGHIERVEPVPEPESKKPTKRAAKATTEKD